MQTETSSARNGLNLVEWFTKGAQCQPQTTQAIAMAIAISCSSQNNSKPLLLKTILIYLIECREFGMLPKQNHHPY